MQPFDREELYAHVWRVPVSKLERELNVSAAEIRAWCKKLQVPLPPQGHWSRLQYGRPVEKIPLPVMPPDAIKEVLNNKSEDVSRQVQEPPVVFPGEHALSFVVPDRLIQPDKLISAAEASLRAAAVDRESGTVRTARGELNIRVTKSNIDRALRIMNTLVKAWRHRGYRVVFKEGDTFVYLREVRQRVRLLEAGKKQKTAGDGPGRRHTTPTGQLVFKMEYWLGREWRDGKQLLEAQILDILNHMEVAARQIERSRAEQAEAESLKIVPPAPPAQKLPSIPNTAKKNTGFKKLLKEAKRWKKQQLVDQYLADIFMRSEHTPEFLEWFAKAKESRA